MILNCCNFKNDVVYGGVDGFFIMFVCAVRSIIMIILCIFLGVFVRRAGVPKPI